MGEKWPQVSPNTALGLLQTENSLGQVHSALFSVHAVINEVGYEVPAEMIGTTLIYMLIFGDFCPFYTSNPGRMLILPSFCGEKEQVYMNGAE